MPQPIASPSPVSAPLVTRHDDELIALLRLPDHPVAAASAIYREVRKGRRVFAVASGAADADRQVAAICDRIGVPATIQTAAAQTTAGSTLIQERVAIVSGGPGAAALTATAPRAPVRIALAGCGVVGGGVLSRLLDDPRYQVVAVLVRDPDKARDIQIPDGIAVTDAGCLLARLPDVVIEALSDASTGLALIRAALSRGVSVISANKQAIGSGVDALRALAISSGARLAFSAAVGGGAPMLETLARAAGHGPIVRIEAVLNGTVNFILNSRLAGHTFDNALKQARLAGFAEEDPSADLEGRDAAAKLAILAQLAFESIVDADAIEVTELNAEVAAALPSGRVRQIARAETGADGVVASVRLVAADDDPLFADLEDEWNALRLTCADGRVFTCRGRGAGRWPTTESVWADLTDLVEA